MIITSVVISLLSAALCVYSLSVTWRSARSRREIARLFRERVRQGSVTVLPPDETREPGVRVHFDSTPAASETFTEWLKKNIRREGPSA